MNARSVLVRPVTFLALLLLPACTGSAGSPGRSGSAGGSGGATGFAGATTNSGAGGSAGAATGTGGVTSEGGSGGGSGGALAGSGGAAAGSGGAAAGSGGVGGATDAGAAGAGGPDGSVKPSTSVVMYLPNWAGSFSSWATRVDFNKMTHLNLAFGTVNTSNAWSLGAQDADVKALAAAAHAKNVKVLVSIGGADDDIGIINQYQSASNIDPLVANLDAFCMRLDLDGVDVDLERGADMKSSGNYPAFVAKLISTFRPEGKLVTTALAQYIVEDAGADPALITVIKSFDLINLMIYSTNMSTYTNELNWWTTTKGVPKSILTWGIEFSSKLTAAMAQQLTAASKAYGGVMVWEYSQGTEPQLWPAVQGSI
jgi:chitinase